MNWILDWWNCTLKCELNFVWNKLLLKNVAYLTILTLSLFILYPTICTCVLYCKYRISSKSRHSKIWFQGAVPCSKNLRAASTELNTHMCTRLHEAICMRVYCACTYMYRHQLCTMRRGLRVAFIGMIRLKYVVIFQGQRYFKVQWDFKEVWYTQPLKFRGSYFHSNLFASCESMTVFSWLETLVTCFDSTWNRECRYCSTKRCTYRGNSKHFV